MMGRTHALSGAAAYLAAAPLLQAKGLDVSTTALLIGTTAAAGGAMLPDLDHPSATVARAAGPVTGLLARGISAVAGGHRNGTHSLLGIAAFTAATAALSAVGGWPLALWLALVFSVGLTALDVVDTQGLAYGAILAGGTFALMGTTVWGHWPADTIPWAVGIGAAAHVAGDMLTPERCPLLWLPVKVAPSITRRRFGVGLFTTNKGVERLVVAPLLLVAAAGLLVERTGHWDTLTGAVGWVTSTARAETPEPGPAPKGVTVVAARPEVAGYDRSCSKGRGCVFGPAWADVDRNGCDTRNDILRRDLTAPVAKPGTDGCVIVAGALTDPYTGQRAVFRKADASKVQIDHVVPLSAAWDLGAHSWDAKRRAAFANDPRNLVAAVGSVNSSKSDLLPAEWMTQVRGDAARCAYANRYVQVSTAYGLPIPKADWGALRDAQRRCGA